MGLPPLVHTVQLSPITLLFKRRFFASFSQMTPLPHLIFSGFLTLLVVKNHEPTNKRQTGRQ